MTQLRIATVYRHFRREGSIPGIFVRRTERLSRDADVTAVCSAATRERTDAQISFVDVEPIVRGDGRVSSALEAGSFALRSGRLLARMRDRFDVVHSQGYASTWADLVTVHAVRRAEIDHYFSEVEPDARIRRRLSPYVFRPHSAVVMGIERRLLSARHPLVICPSQAIKRDVLRVHGVPAENVEVIPPGADIARHAFDTHARHVHRRDHGVADGTLVVLLIATEFERKGVGRAIEGLGRSGIDGELWVIGGDDQRPYLSQASRAGLRGRVRFLGSFTSDELASWYSAADIVLLPSRQDSWGHPIPEGMAAERVVIASEYTGAQELLDHGRNGFVLRREGDPAEIAALLRQLADVPDERASIGARALGSIAHLDHELAHRRFLQMHYRAYHERRSADALARAKKDASELTTATHVGP